MSERPRPTTTILGRETRIGRRALIRGTGALLLVAPFGGVLSGCSSDDDPASPFQHGVASGDPLPDGFILWTRVTTDGARVDVEWEVAEDPEMNERVASGSFATDADRDHTVKVDVRGLVPGRAYYYRFRALGGSSRIGRVRTAPSGPTSRLRFALAACASYAHGYFHGYREIGKLADLDAVVHLGDYIYEYGNGEYGDVRTYEPPHELLTLEDYRTRHAHYKRDPDLQEAHRQHAFITIWDDHEIANDAYRDGAENHNTGEGAWTDRRAAAIRAYREWMPIRESTGGEIFRKLSFGDLADLVLLDTRHHGRTKQAGGITGAPPAPDPARTLLGDDQAAWVEDSVRTSAARWKLLAQQVMVGQLLLDQGRQLANLDQWHGYPESRKRLLDFLRDSGVKDVVVLTGDIHSSWANEIVFDPNDAATYDPVTGRGSVGVEFVTPGIGSPGIPSIFLGIIEPARKANPHVKYLDATRRGFVVLDVTPERVQSAWYLFEDIVSPEPVSPSFATAWSVRAGSTHVEQDAGPAPAPPDVSALAP